jgi:hypothetical protein
MIKEDANIRRGIPDNTNNTVANNLKTATGAKQKYSDFLPSGIKGAEVASGMESITKGLESNAKGRFDKALGDLSKLSSKLSFNMPNFGSENVDGDDDGDGIIKQLIKLIKGVITLPIRFTNMSLSLSFATTALATGIDGLGKSLVLGSKDIITLVSVIVKFVMKYIICIVSFVITTMGGCFIIHCFTFMCYVLYLIFPFTAYCIQMVMDYDINPHIDAMFEELRNADEYLGQYTGGIYALRWPDPIQSICYTCFGKKVKLRELLIDVGAIQDVGNTISTHFTKVMPNYMRSSVPHGQRAMNYLDAAVN